MEAQRDVFQAIADPTRRIIEIGKIAKSDIPFHQKMWDEAINRYIFVTVFFLILQFTVGNFLLSSVYVLAMGEAFENINSTFE